MLEVHKEHFLQINLDLLWPSMSLQLINRLQARKSASTCILGQLMLTERLFLKKPKEP